MTDLEAVLALARELAWSSCFAAPDEKALRALRDIVDPDDEHRCVDCGVEVDGLGPPICRECSDVDD